MNDNQQEGDRERKTETQPRRDLDPDVTCLHMANVAQQPDDLSLLTFSLRQKMYNEKDKRGSEGRGGKTNQMEIVTDPSDCFNLSLCVSLCLTSTETMLIKTKCDHLTFFKYTERSKVIVLQCRVLRQICSADPHDLCSQYGFILKLLLSS